MSGVERWGKGVGPASLAVSPALSAASGIRRLGGKRYELADHLGNVRAVISDVRQATVSANSVTFATDVKSFTDYYAFPVLSGVEGGWAMPGRNYSAGEYRFGFNGKESAPELYGEDAAYDFGARVYDGRTGRWSSCDPLEQKYPGMTTYGFCFGNPTNVVDMDGREGVPVYISRRGGYSYYPSLQPYQWYVESHPLGAPFYTPYSESFNKAALYNTKNNNTLAYTNISERHDYYAWADKKISNARWFAASEIVTRYNSVGAADGLNVWFVNDAAERFLKEGNKFLFTYNMANAKSLINNGGLSGDFTDANGQKVTFDCLSGKELDYAMVQFEQTKVQDFIGQYKANNPGASIDEIMGSINYSMGSKGAPSEVKKVMRDYFNTGNGQKAFDFRNYNHRVLLGQKIIDQLYEEEK